MENNKDLGKTSFGMQPNVAGVLCYLAGWITGLIFYLLEKENKFVRFHAMQSIIVFGFLFILSIFLRFIPFLGWFVNMLVSIATLVLWIVLMVKAYQKEFFKIPIAGDIAEKNS